MAPIWEESENGRPTVDRGDAWNTHEAGGEPVDLKWIIALVALGAAVLSVAVFFGLAALGNEWRLRNEEWSPDEPAWTDE